jgi:hypothetical protein
MYFWFFSCFKFSGFPNGSKSNGISIVKHAAVTGRNVITTPFISDTVAIDWDL